DVSTPINNQRTAVVTGASAGIGAAIARHLSLAGFNVIIGARRKAVLDQLATEIGATAVALDVTDIQSIKNFCSDIEKCDVLVNNAGGAFGLEPVAEAVDEHWMRMYEINVMSVMRMTRELLP